jgi:diguanylate cyclase (GGDEF)-like protein
VQVAAERYAAAVDPLAAAVMVRRACVDALTGALSRNFGMDALRHEVNRAQRRNTALTIGFLDVDQLKMINDSRGHRAGDAALAVVGAQVRQRIRDYDVFVRFGGDEFVVAFPDATALEADERLTAIQAALDRQTPPVGVSFGVAELSADEHLEHLLERADAELYRRRSSVRAQLPEPRRAAPLVPAAPFGVARRDVVAVDGPLPWTRPARLAALNDTAPLDGAGDAREDTAGVSSDGCGAATLPPGRAVESVATAVEQ